MFDWLGDIFNSDTFDTLSNGFSTLKSGMQTVSPFVQGGLSLINGLDSANRAKAFSVQQGATASQLADLFSPNSPYALELRRQLERRDAAAGRRSQYGTRETELAAALTRNQAGVLGAPQYQQLLAGANRSPYGGLMGSLGQLFSFKDQNGNFKTPPGTSKAVSYMADTLFPAALPDISIAGLGGAESAIGATPTVDAGTYSLLGGTEGQLPGYSEAGGPQGEGIFSGYGTGVGGELAAADLGGAGAALSGGVGSGALGGTVGGADALGGMLGGTGFLPSYGAAATEAGLGAGSTAGAGGLFGGSGAAAGAGAEGAGAAGAGFGGAGAASLVALPFALAIGGMLNGIFGGPDGPPKSVRDRANEYADLTGSYNAGADWRGWGDVDLNSMTPTTYGGSGDMPMYNIGMASGAYDSWMNQPGVRDYYNNALANYGKDTRSGLDMSNRYYMDDNPLLSAYLYSQYGNPNSTQMGKGLGGYSDDQYAAASDYFQNTYSPWTQYD